MASRLANIAGLFLWILFPTLRQWRSLSAPRTATPWGGAAERGERDPGTVTPPVAASLVEASRNQRPTPNPRGSHWRDPHEWARPAPTLSLSLSLAPFLSLSLEGPTIVSPWTSECQRKRKSNVVETVKTWKRSTAILKCDEWHSLSWTHIVMYHCSNYFNNYLQIHNIIFNFFPPKETTMWQLRSSERFENSKHFCTCTRKKRRHWRRWRPKSLILFPQQRRKSIFFFTLQKQRLIDLFRTVTVMDWSLLMESSFILCWIMTLEKSVQNH